MIRSLPLHVTTAIPVSFDEGFYPEEQQGVERFHWMGERGLLRFVPDPAVRFLELWVLSEFYDLSQRLLVRAADRVEDCALPRGWSQLSLQVPAGAAHIELHVNKLFPREHYPGDPRTLGIRVRAPRLHRDPERHAVIRAQQQNSVRNAQEILDGRTRLESTPPNLGIDLHGACNVKPPCVYCEWDFNKNLEGDNINVPFTRDTLREWGPFFDNSVQLVNCSIGEPFMMKNLDELLDIFADTGKVLEMATNGQILTDRNIQKLLGRPIDLYISLDAATSLTYSRLRNDTFDRILGNLRRLIAAKGGKGRLPSVHLVFMPMKCNLHELEGFVRLCADLQADRMVLRPLNYSDITSLDRERAGYRYIYKDELLPFDTLARASGRAARLCAEVDLEFADQMDFDASMPELFDEELARRASDAFDLSATQPAESATIALEHAQPIDAPAASLPSLGAERRPACLEPWTSLYIMRRGILPCCYGWKAIAGMNEYREAWNSPLVQEIRSELLKGRFHDYCLHSVACPVVRKAEHAATLPLRQRLLVRARHMWGRLNRDTNNAPRRYVYFPLSWFGVRLRRAATDPSYIAHHAGRLIGKTSGRAPER